MNNANELIELENARCEALSTGDMAQLERSLADDYIHAHNTGYTTNKAETIALLQRMPRVSKRGDLVVRFYGDGFAVLTGSLTNIRTTDGVEKIQKGYVTQVAVRNAGGWQFVSYHVSFVPPEKAS